MNEPPPYPRIPYLRVPRAEPDAPAVPEANLGRWFGEPLIVEEKLDGANVSVWLDENAMPQAAGRAGAGAMDRSGQLGRLRAWAAERIEALSILLDGGFALYGEWLWLAHTIAYDRLPDWLVVIDVWSPQTGFLSIGDRDGRATAAGLATPPRILRGVLGGWAQLEGLVRPSAFGAPVAEGLVLRRQQDHETCKFVPETFRRLDDAAWRAGRPTNQLATVEHTGSRWSQRPNFRWLPRP
jgi:hypothetical protein